MISDTAGKKARPYFPLYFLIYVRTFLQHDGMIPYSFTVTSHIIVTLILAIFIFIAVTIIGLLAWIWVS